MSIVKNLPKIQIGDKSIIKRVVGAVRSCLQTSDGQTAAELVGHFGESPTFKRLWDRISVPIEKPEMPISQRLQVLRLALSLVPKLQTEAQIKTVVTPNLLLFLRKQLSSQKLASHEDICRCLNRLLQHLKTSQPDELALVGSNNDCRFPTPSIGATQAAQIFTVVASQLPLFDAAVTPKSPQLVSTLLECASTALSDDYLYEWSSQLQKLFLSPKDDSSSTSAVDRTRLHILDLLRQVAFIFIARSSEAVIDSIEEILAFLLLVANNNAFPLGSAEPAVTAVVASASLTHLGRCLGLMVRGVSLRAEMKDSSLRSKSSKETLRMLLRVMNHLVETDEKVCTNDGEDLLQCLKTAGQLLATALESTANADSLLSCWISLLHAVTVIYAVTLHSNPPSPKESVLLTLIDDISEALKHRNSDASVPMETDLDEASNYEAAPEWSSVFTDAMLSLCVEPWRLLREVIAATFGRMVSHRELFAPPLAPEEAFAVGGKPHKQKDEGKTVSPLQLIISIADNRSNAAQERVVLAGKDDGDDDEDEEEDGNDDSSDNESESEGEQDESGDEEMIDLGAGENDDESVEDIPEATDADDFLTDEQMDAQDEALAAIFRATQSSKLEARSRKDTIALLKLRSFDFLECIVLYSCDANLFLPSLYTILQLAIASARRNSKHEPKGSRKQSPGCVQLARILATLNQLRARSSASNDLLYKSLSGSDESVALLSAFLTAVFATFKNAVPDEGLIKCLHIVCEFLQFKKVASPEDSRTPSKVVQSVVQDVLTEFLSKPHPSRTHQSLLKRLLSTSPAVAKSAAGLLAERLAKAATSESPEGIYSQTALLHLANAVTVGLAKQSDVVREWTLPFAKTLVSAYFSGKVSAGWTQSRVLASAVFSALIGCIKADKTVLDELSSTDLTTLLTLERGTLLKSVRPYLSRVTMLIHSLRGSSGHVSKVITELSVVREQMKREAKQERRAKRQQRAAAQQLKRKAAAEESVESEETKPRPQAKRRKTKSKRAV
uniref:Myb-binding protein 1A-like protein n=1 Tax=Mesocestoides corti TaxID=53468 RepID=A0A5K3F4E8_MESCO